MPGAEQLGHRKGPRRRSSVRRAGRIRDQRPGLQAGGQVGRAPPPGVQGDHPDRHQELRELLLMSRPRGLLALVALVAVAAGVMALGGVGTARSSKPKVVKLYDNYYSPVSVKIRKRGKVKWKWTPVFNTHNVKLTEAPRGVRKSRFRSQTSSSPTYTFTKRFRKPGKYHFICTIH